MGKNNVASLLTSVDELFTTQEERDAAKRETVVDLQISEISDFPNHPFSHQIHLLVKKRFSTIKPDRGGRKKSKKEESGKYIDETVWYECKVDNLAKLNQKNIPKFRLETFTYKKGKSPGKSTIEYGTYEKAAIEWLLNMILTDGGIADPYKGYSFKTREKFATTIQPYLSYFIQYLLGYPEIMDEIEKLFKKDPIMTPVRWFQEKDGIYSDMKKILDKYHIAYNDTELKKSCNALYEMADFRDADFNGCLTNIILELIPKVAGSNKDLSRMVYLHRPDMAWILLWDYLN